jgi:hypothetical protein
MRKWVILGGLGWLFLVGDGSLSQGWAAEPAWWTEQKRVCGLPPGLAYNNWNGECRGGTSNPPPPAIDYEALRLNDLTSRFNVLLNILRAYDVPNIGDLYTAAAPATIVELGRRVDRLYVETAFHKSRQYWKYEENAKDLISLPAALSALRTENVKLEENLITAPGRLKNAEAQRDRSMAKAESEEYVASVLRNNAAIVEDDFLTARGKAMWTIHSLLPADKKAAFHEGMKKGDALPAYTIQQLYEPAAAAIITPQRPAELNVSRRDSIGLTQKPPPLAGSIEVKLDAFEDLKTVLGYVGPIIPSQEKRLAAFREQGAQLRKNNDSLLERLQTFESPLEKAKALADDAEQRLLTAQINQKISANNLLRLATAAVIWNHIKNTVVIPQIEQILKANGLSNGVKGVAMIDQIQKSPQDFLPKVGPLKDLPRLIETGKKILNIEENMESFALGAAGATGQIGTAESDILVGHIFHGLSKSGTDIMRTASGAMEGIQGKVAQVLMERAP